MAQATTADVDGDGTMTVDDSYGFVSSPKQVLPNFWMAAGEKSIAKDKDDLPYLNIDGNERFFGIVEKVFQMMWDGGIWYPTSEDSNFGTNVTQQFSADRALFAGQTFYYLREFRDIETDFGIINYLLTRIGLGKVSWLGSTGTIIASTVFISIWQSGKMIIINLSGLQAIPTVLYEAADLDGCSKLRQVFHITLPMMSPVLFMNLLIGLIGAFKTFTQIKILTDGGPSNASLVYMLYIYKTAFVNFNLGYANALSILLFVIVGALTILVFRSSNKWVFYGGE